MGKALQSKNKKMIIEITKEKSKFENIIKIIMLIVMGVLSLFVFIRAYDIYFLFGLLFIVCGIFAITIAIIIIRDFNKDTKFEIECKSYKEVKN